LTYLLQSVAQPTGNAGKALAGIGITPQFVSQRGIYAGLMRLLHSITNTGNARLIAQIPDEQLDDTSNLPGIPANEMIRLRQMIPRIHGIRAAIILAHQLRQQGNVGSLAQDLQMMQDEQNNQVDDAHNFALAWQNFRKRSRLQEATVAVNALTLQMAQTFEPLFNFIARGPIALQRVMQHHQHGTRIASWGALGAIAGIGAARLLNVGGTRLGNIPVLGRLLGGGAGNAFVQARAVEAAISGNTTLGATPQNPMYVVIVGQLFNASFRPGNKTTSTGGLGTVVSGAEAGGGAAAGVKGARLLGRARGGIFRLARGALGLADEAAVRGGSALADTNFLAKWGMRGARFGGIPLALLTELAFPDSTAKDRNRFTVQRAKQLFGPSITGLERPAIGTMHGRAELWLTLDINSGGKITRRRVHIPADMWSGGRHPTRAGRPGSQRSR
jgi:hypothetical protein